MHPGRHRVTIERIVDCALALLDDEGLDALTTTNLARRLGISQPAIYSHVANLDEIRERTALRGAAELSDRVRAAVAGRVGDNALAAMAHAYRDYVRSHPARYLLQLSVRQTPTYLAATEQSAEAVRTVLRSFGLTEHDVLGAHLAFRAGVHGFVHLEANGALPESQAERNGGFDAFVRLFTAGVRQMAAATR